MSGAKLRNYVPENTRLGVAYTDGTGTHMAMLDADTSVKQPAGSGPSKLVTGSALDWFFATAADSLKNKLRKGETLSTL